MQKSHRDDYPERTEAYFQSFPMQQETKATPTTNKTAQTPKTSKTSTSPTPKETTPEIIIEFENNSSNTPTNTKSNENDVVMEDNQQITDEKKEEKKDELTDKERNDTPGSTPDPKRIKQSSTTEEMKVDSNINSTNPVPFDDHTSTHHQSEHPQNLQLKNQFSYPNEQPSQQQQPTLTAQEKRKLRNQRLQQLFQQPTIVINGAPYWKFRVPSILKQALRYYQDGEQIIKATCKTSGHGKILRIHLNKTVHPKLIETIYTK